MESKADLEDYLTELLDPQNRKHKKFIDDFLMKWQPSRDVSTAVPDGITVSIPCDFAGYLLQS